MLRIRPGRVWQYYPKHPNFVACRFHSNVGAVTNAAEANRGHATSGEASSSSSAGDYQATIDAMWRFHRRRSGSEIPKIDEDVARRLIDEIRNYVSESDSGVDRSAQETLIHQVGLAAGRVLDGCSVKPFGSAATGLMTPGSDLDLCVMVPGGSDRHWQTRFLRKIAGELRRTGASHHVLPRIGAQMPIVRWEPRREGVMACDISVNNALAVANSHLLSAYVKADARVRPLALCVKGWAQARRINDRSVGTLSSFSLVLMVVHFLQQRSPPILPSLQDLAVNRGQPPVFLHGADCRFSSRTSELQAEIHRLRGIRDANAEELGILLCEFFRFFSYEYEHGTIATRSRAAFQLREDEDTCYLVVDNPFEPGKDVANVDPRHYTRIREEFRRAHAILCDGDGFNIVCATPSAPGHGDPLVGPVRPLEMGASRFK